MDFEKKEFINGLVLGVISIFILSLFNVLAPILGLKMIGVIIIDVLFLGFYAFNIFYMIRVLSELDKGIGLIIGPLAGLLLFGSCLIFPFS